jgi:GTPase SAR1 family protein
MNKVNNAVSGCGKGQKTSRSKTSKSSSSSPGEVKRVKCILMGDTVVGKTSLVHSFLFDKPVSYSSDDHIPTARDDYTFCTTVGSSGSRMDVDLDICDTGGHVRILRF